MVNVTLDGGCVDRAGLDNGYNIFNKLVVSIKRVLVDIVVYVGTISLCF